MTEPDVAVRIPCHDEAVAIAGVIADFRAALQAARIFVYDNNSTDETAQVAAFAGATVRKAPRESKGAIVRKMFRDMKANAYLIVDGDQTYDAMMAPQMLALAMDDFCDTINCNHLLAGAHTRDLR